VELLRDGSHDGQIHAADQFCMFSGQRIEGAVAQHDAATSAAVARTRSPSKPGRCRREAERGLVEGQRMLGLGLRGCAPTGARGF
jgi:hypothetical protein